MRGGRFVHFAGPPGRSTRLCLPFGEDQPSSGMIVTKWRCRISHGRATMPRREGHDRREVRTYTLPEATCAPKAPPLDSVGGFRAPSTHDMGPRPLTLPNPARIGCALRSLAPETQRQGALLPRHSQRQGFRAPTPTASVFPLEQDERLRRSLASR